MLELTPSLSVTLAPLVRLSGSVPRAIGEAADAGFHSVQLSAATPGIRPRELGKRARRDVLALLARRGLALGGIDLMIPHKDWLSGSTQDRAMTAATAAIELAADWGKVPLAMTLPVERLPEEIQRELLTAADAHGVLLAIHAEHDVKALQAWLEREDQPVLAAAIDPAALLAKGDDPADVAISLARWVRVAKLDDYSNVSTLGSGGRCALGQGELDLDHYRAALATCSKLRAMVLDLRDLEDVRQAMDHAQQVWEVY
ncbi:MAG: TIM barrel protein [Phycisphaeraceae bacterium]